MVRQEVRCGPSLSSGRPPRIVVEGVERLVSRRVIDTPDRRDADPSAVSSLAPGSGVFRARGERARAVSDELLSPRILGGCQRAGTVLAVGTGLLGAVVLLGWVVGNHTLTSISPSFVSMKPNTAVGFVLAAVAVLATRSRLRGSALIGGVCATVVAAIGLTTLAEYWSGHSLGIDELLFEDISAVGTSSPGRMAPTTAASFALLGVALLTQRLTPIRAHRRLLTSAFLLVVLVGYLNLAGYLYGAPKLYGVGAFTQMAVHTAAGFVLIGMAPLLFDRDGLVPRSLAIRGAGGKLCRLVLPTVLVVLLLLGWLETQGEQRRSYDHGTGIALLVTVASVILTAATALAIRSLNREEVQRSSAEQALADLNRDLEATVEARTQDLQNSVAALTTNNAQLDSFAYSVSHDLRSPLRSITGFSHALVLKYDQSLPAEARHFVDRIVAGAEKMDQLIIDLLEFARSGRDALRLDTIQPDAIVEELAGLIHADEGERVSVVWNELPPCLADGTLLRQVFWNLLDNAVKFSRTRQPAFIEVSGAVEGQECVYCVTDNGVGFNPTYSSQLFGAFKRLHGSTTYEGSGIGLAVVERIVERHGGRVWAHSGGTSGATFCFSIPGEQHG